MFPLNQKVLRYQKTRQGLARVVDEILIFIFYYLQRRFHMDDDQRSEFLLFFQPQIARIVNRYRDIGSSFEAYLCTHIRFQVRSFFQLHHGKYYKERLLESETVEGGERIVSLPEHAAPEPVHDIMSFGEMQRQIKQQRSVRVESLRRRMLFFILKYVHSFSEAQLSYLARHFGYDEEQLFFIRQQSRERLTAREEKIALLEKKRNDMFFTLQYLRRKSECYMEAHSYAVIQKKIQKTQKRVEKLSRTLACVPRSLTNQDVAEILKVSKGTVDSGIFLLKKQLKRCQPDSDS